jgi:uncharacterized protein YjbI with pentapeptide repeats
VKVATRSRSAWYSSGTTGSGGHLSIHPAVPGRRRIAHLLSLGSLFAGDVEQDEHSPARRPSTDIQAILDVLNRREEDHVPEQHRVLLNLPGADLEGADLEGADLLDANEVTKKKLADAQSLQGATMPDGSKHH